LPTSGTSHATGLARSWIYMMGQKRNDVSCVRQAVRHFRQHYMASKLP